MRDGRTETCLPFGDLLPTQLFELEELPTLRPARTTFPLELKYPLIIPCEVDIGYQGTERGQGERMRRGEGVKEEQRAVDWDASACRPDRRKVEGTMRRGAD